MKKDLLISFSGGRTSAMMTKYLLDKKSDEYNFKVVFANTGHEKEATLEFVKKCDDIFGFNTIWVEAITNPTFKKGVSDMIEESELLELDEYAKDESRLLETAKQISMWDNKLDFNGGCIESCEAF